MMNQKIKAGIIGAAGYTGGELIRLLLNHPEVNLVFAASNSNTGKYVYEVHQDLLGETQLKFSNPATVGDIDVVFLCAGHGAAKAVLDSGIIPEGVNVIDLSQDFRMKQDAQYANRQFVYGLPELNREVICSASNIANPGCFATAIQLALLPLAHAGLLGDVYTTGITGSTGAGQSLSATTHFSWRANNISAYKTLEHQHIREITESLNQLQAAKPLSSQGGSPGVWFVPWRGDFSRGIFTSSTVDCALKPDEVTRIYQDFYKDARFTHVSEGMVDLKQVVNTNKCLIHLEHVGPKLVIHTVLDNLLKGASGQAVQNMNLLFGLAEDAGLKLKSPGF